MSQATESASADPQQVIANLQQQLDERTAERDEARTLSPPQWGRAGVGVTPRTDPW